jgi:hypothetical protein
MFTFDLDSAEGNQQLQFSDHSHSTLIFNAMPMSYIRCVKHSVAKQMVIRTAKRSATAATALRCSPSSLAVAALEDDVLRPVVARSRPVEGCQIKSRLLQSASLRYSQILGVAADTETSRRPQCSTRSHDPSAG